MYPKRKYNRSTSNHFQCQQFVVILLGVHPRSSSLVVYSLHLYLVLLLCCSSLFLILMTAAVSSLCMLMIDDCRLVDRTSGNPTGLEGDIHHSCLNVSSPCSSAILLKRRSRSIITAMQFVSNRIWRYDIVAQVRFAAPVHWKEVDRAVSLPSSSNRL